MTEANGHAAHVNWPRRTAHASLRTIILALAALLAASLSPARADSGTVRISFIKAGWVIGGTVGSGTLTFRGRTYPLSVGGMSYGFTFGGSQTNLRGTVSNIFQPVRHRRRLWRRRRGRDRHPRTAGDRADQPERRGAATERHADRADGQPRRERDGADAAMTRNNLIYLVVGALCVGVAVLGYQLYQERQKPGLSISIGGKDGLKIEGK